MQIDFIDQNNEFFIFCNIVTSDYKCKINKKLQVVLYVTMSTFQGYSAKFAYFMENILNLIIFNPKILLDLINQIIQWYNKMFTLAHYQVKV